MWSFAEENKRLPVTSGTLTCDSALLFRGFCVISYFNLAAMGLLGRHVVLCQQLFTVNVDVITAFQAFLRQHRRINQTFEGFLFMQAPISAIE